MKKLFKATADFIVHSPVVDYTTTLFQYRAGLKYFPRILIYYLKFGFFEPFRLIEAIFFGGKIAHYRFQQDPIFILGYYRSGTTHLQETLMCDPKIGYMNFFQTYFCAGFLITERLFKKTFGIIMRAQNFHHPAHRVLFDFDMPGEEDVCLVASGYRFAPNWGQVYPRYFRRLFKKFVFFETCTDQERSDFENELMRLYKRVAMAKSNQGKRMLFKSPPQTARVQMLLRLFPNAKFVFIHRNPYEIYKSNQRLWKSFKDQCLQNDPESPNEKILWSMNKCYESYERDKSSIPAGNLLEVSYSELLQDPMRTMKHIYESLNLSDFNAAKPHMEKFLARRHGINIDRHLYTEEDFRMVETHSQKWIDHGGYSRPQ